MEEKGREILQADVCWENCYRSCQGLAFCHTLPLGTRAQHERIACAHSLEPYPSYAKA